ncbi:MAG: hypothetical protein JXR37_21225 [Kiritimatiellae bacterium]|nr:hypothetical protein [Kiritimatiellia bacterium]
MKAHGEAKRAERPAERPWLTFPRALLALAALTLVMFGDVLLVRRDRVLSSPGTDLYLQFVHWRAFGFGELRGGNLPLWNPHIFCGMPYFGGFQSALLYPPNVVYLLLPLPAAVNAGIALHVLLGGVFMYLWAKRRGLHPLACLLGAVLLMFCGAHFLHVYAGHLPNLCTMIWAPLLLLAVDGLFEEGHWRYAFLGSFAVAMQVLAGHPQYVFYTGVAVALYAGLRLWKAERRLRTALTLGAMYLAGALLTAVQLAAGMQAAAETVRSRGVPYEFAAMFSFPPENVLATLLAPGFFGDMTGFPYWGRCYLWEMSLFIGVTGLMLAVYAVAAVERPQRRFGVVMFLLLLLLALGSHTPLFAVLYRFVPGFNAFRGNSKFAFQATLFLVMLACAGYDRFLRDRAARRALIALLATAGTLALLAVVIRGSAAAGSPASFWGGWLRAMRATNESYFATEQFTNGVFIRESAAFASNTLWLAVLTVLALALLVYLSGKRRWAALAVGGLAAAEVLLFAVNARVTFDFAATDSPELRRQLAAQPCDYRVLNIANPNAAMSLGTFDLWGNDPGVLLRYSEFITWTQGQNPDQAGQYVRFAKYHPLYRMLRCRYVIVPAENGARVQEVGAGMPRLCLVQRARVAHGRDAVLAAMAEPSFDPRRTVILETEPEPPPVETEQKGTVRLLDASTDHLTIEADLPQPAVLLVTDGYSRGWRAQALAGSVQSAYQVLPANYVLRGVPLAVGRHRLRLVYRPAAFAVGAWVSGLALLAFLGALALQLWRCRNR